MVHICVTIRERPSRCHYNKIKKIWFIKSLFSKRNIFNRIISKKKIKLFFTLNIGENHETKELDSTYDWLCVI
jgi:hypothetical protein